LVHRIDKDTSGLLVIAKTEKAMTGLAKQFFDHSIERTYYAVVWGEPEEAGTIDVHLGRSLKDRRVTTAFPEGDFGRTAITHYKVLKYLRYVSLVQCNLETGRTHQIRAHMKYLGHPLFNDATYGGDQIVKGTQFTKYKAFVQNCFKTMPRQALHAKSLGFVHPVTKEPMQFDSELPEDFTAKAQADGILLSWGKLSVGKIRIERSADASSWKTLEVNPTPENTWLDTDASQGKTWFYRARITVHEVSGALHLGKATAPLRAEFADIYPPSPPTELLCLPEAGKIRLRWLASDEAASYRIEREDSDGKTSVLAEKFSELSIVDRKAPPGKLVYRVWAVDEAGNRSEPAECQSVSEGSR